MTDAGLLLFPSGIWYLASGAFSVVPALYVSSNCPSISLDHGILEKAGQRGLTDADADCARLGNLEELLLLKMLIQFPEEVASAVAEYNPSRVAAHIFNTAKAFNQFYNKHAVIQAESPATAAARLALIKATLPRRRILELFEASKVRHLSAEDVYKALLAEGMDSGLCGFSIQRLGPDSTQADFDGSPMVTDTMADEDILALAKKAAQTDPEPDTDWTADDGRALAGMIREMDAWLRKGGTLPAPWREGQRRR